ncbi:hypothetical protein B4Q13_17940, partial [Lacticaseibacillus rhamnosus]
MSSPTAMTWRICFCSSGIVEIRRRASFHSEDEYRLNERKRQRVEGDQHHLNGNDVLVGETAKARKGTSWGRVQQVFEQVPKWPTGKKGLSTGEGLKWAVRDKIENLETDKRTGRAVRAGND